MRNYKINSIFVGLEKPKARKTGVYFFVFLLLLKENCLLYDKMDNV